MRMVSNRSLSVFEKKRLREKNITDTITYYLDWSASRERSFNDPYIAEVFR